MTLPRPLLETIALYLKIARFDHWIKQLFIIPGMVFALVLIKTVDVMAISHIIMCFLSTSFVASANYIINEWLDADFDKYHPTKKNRPVVSAHLKPRCIITEYIVFAAAGLVIAWFVSRFVFFIELLLFIMGIVYNVPPVRSKEIPYIDVLSESLNNALRLLIGWFIITVQFLPPISIVFGYWMGGAFLMAMKRFAEYRMIGDKNQAGLYRKSFKYYTEKSLLISALFYALLSVFFCGIFMIKYRIELLLAIPFLCGLFCIYLNICYKPDSSAQKPEKLFQEKALLLYILFFYHTSRRINDFPTAVFTAFFGNFRSWDLGMKQKRHKSLQEYRLIILDMDGTLYYQFPLRICMCIELLLYYILHIGRIKEIFMLRRFRKSYESGILEEGNSAVAYWMQEKPLRYITLFRDKKLLYLIRQLRERGARIAVYSDYPAQRKISALPDFTVDYCFCAADTVIQCLKPETRGLKNILRIIGEPVENSLFIGDRYEKDGKCAEGLGMDYIILDKNPVLRNRNLYKKEFKNDR